MISMAAALLLALAVQESDPETLLVEIEFLVDSSRRDPENAALQFELGSRYAALGRFPQAAEAFGRALELSPAERSYAFAYGELLYRAGRAEDAVPYLDKASSLPEAALLLAGAYETLGREADSVITLEAYVEAKPDDEGARLLLAEKFEKAKRLDEALRVYRQGLAIEPRNSVLLGRMAEIQSRSRDTYADAEANARLSLDADSELVESRLVLARILGRTGREEEALSELERARMDRPDLTEVQYLLAQAYQKAGRVEEAQAAAAKFQELSAKEKRDTERVARVAATYKNATELLRAGQMLEAERVFRSILELEPDHAQTRSMLAKIAFSKNDLAAAKAWIEEAIAADSSVAEYHYLKALFSMRAGNVAEAEPSARRSLELEPGLAEAWSLLGTILLDSKRAGEALVCFSRAAALEPSNAATQLNLAAAHAALGNDAEEAIAMDRYQELLRRP
jgi:predicted Zn-dependent protease